MVGGGLPHQNVGWADSLPMLIFEQHTAWAIKLPILQALALLSLRRSEATEAIPYVRNRKMTTATFCAFAMDIILVMNKRVYMEDEGIRPCAMCGRKSPPSSTTIRKSLSNTISPNKRNIGTVCSDRRLFNKEASPTPKPKA